MAETVPEEVNLPKEVEDAFKTLKNPASTPGKCLRAIDDLQVYIEENDPSQAIKDEIALCFSEILKGKSEEALTRNSREEPPSEQKVEARTIILEYAVDFIKEPATLIPILTEYSGHKETEIRKAAAEGLGNEKTKSPEGLAVLLAITEDKTFANAGVREKAIKSLALYIDTPEALECIVRASEDHDKDQSDCKRAATNILTSRFGKEGGREVIDEVAIEHQIRKLKDNNPEIRATAAGYLASACSTIGNYENPSERKSYAMLMTAIDPLIEVALTDDKNEQASLQAMLALESVHKHVDPGQQEAIERCLLKIAAGDSNPDVSDVAVRRSRALLGDKEEANARIIAVIQDHINDLKGQDAAIRKDAAISLANCCQSLGRYESPSETMFHPVLVAAIEPLLAVARADSEKEVCKHAMQALENIHGYVNPALQKEIEQGFARIAVGNGDPVMLSTAGNTLGNLIGNSAAENAIALENACQDVRCSVTKAEQQMANQNELDSTVNLGPGRLNPAKKSAFEKK